MSKQDRDVAVCYLINAEQVIDEVGELRKDVDETRDQLRKDLRQYGQFGEAIINAKIEPLYRQLDRFEAHLNDCLVRLSDWLINDNNYVRPLLPHPSMAPTACCCTRT